MTKTTKLSDLPEVTCIDVLESIEHEFARRFGARPFNISHWDPSEIFQKEMLRHIDLPSLSSVINYSFSYTVAQGERVLEKLGGTSSAHGFLLTPSGTSSIISVVNWLANQNLEHLLVACPAYFPIFHACRRFGIEVETVFMIRRGCDFSLPKSLSTMRDHRPALFITNPVYCTGVYLEETVITFVADLLKDGWIVVADECLCLPGRELWRTFGQYPTFVGIYSPHKCVCMNGIKFSAVLFHQQFRSFFEQWSDVFSGGLGCSTIMAIEHFLSANFETYSTHFVSMIDRHRSSFHQTCRSNLVDFDRKAQGHFATCYVPSIPADLATSKAFLRRLVHETCGSLIFGNRSRFNPELGITFRVNLARSGPHFMPTLSRLVRFLKAFS